MPGRPDTQVCLQALAATGTAPPPLVHPDTLPPLKPFMVLVKFWITAQVLSVSKMPAAEHSTKQGAQWAQ